MKMIKGLITVVVLATLGFSAQALAEVGAARALFAQSIVDREPVDQTVELTNDISKVYFFTELQGLNGKSVTHRWEYAGEPHAAVTFNIGSDRWRTWSSKNLEPGWTGVWTVSVVDEDGNVLAEESLNYVAAEATDATDESAATEMVGDAPAE